jgi:CopG family nickel-responsive transcriptional regulator
MDRAAPGEGQSNLRAAPIAAEEPRDALARISMSLPEKLLASIDRLVCRRRLPSRSHAIALIVAQYLAENVSPADERTPRMGTITLVHSESYEVQKQLNEVRRRYAEQIISRASVQVGREWTLEVLIVKGTPRYLMLLGQELEALRGICFAKAEVIPALLEIELNPERFPGQPAQVSRDRASASAEVFASAELES